VSEIGGLTQTIRARGGCRAGVATLVRGLSLIGVHSSDGAAKMDAHLSGAGYATSATLNVCIEIFGGTRLGRCARPRISIVSMASDSPFHLGLVRYFRRD